MRYKLSADTIRMALCDFLKTETDLFWQKDRDVRVSIGTNHETGEDTFRVDILDLSHPASTAVWHDALRVNSLTIDLYRPVPYVQTHLREFAETVRNQLRLML